MFNTDLFKKTDKSPIPYIEVNSRTRERQLGDKGAIIVRFDWGTHIKFMKKTNKDYKNKYHSVFTEHFGDVLHGKSGDQDVNELVNDSLLSMRVTLTHTLGGSNGTITLENFNYFWTFRSKTIPSLYGISVFSEGMYVTIDAKGRFNPNRYYRIFTGVVTGINEVDSPMNRQVTLSISDYSRFLKYTRYNSHPALSDRDFLAKAKEPTVFPSNLTGKTNIEIAKLIIPQWKTFQELGMDLRSILIKDLWTLQSIKDSWRKNMGTGVPSGDIINRNFSYSYQVKDSTYDSTKNNPTPLILVWGDAPKETGSSYQIYRLLFGRFSLYQTEAKTVVDILNETALATFFSCYIDASGNIHYHPPRYEYVSKKQKPYVVGLYDAVVGEVENPYIHVLLEDESLSEIYNQNEGDIVTRLWLKLEPDLLEDPQNISPEWVLEQYVWLEGVDRYGLREKNVSTSAFKDLDAARPFGLAALIRLQLERKKLSTTMPMRSELQVDRPFYVPHKNMIYHISSISHSYTSGGDRSPGDYTTAVDCYAGRPLDHATTLVSNLFRELTVDQLKSLFKEIGYEITIGKIQPSGR